MNGSSSSGNDSSRTSAVPPRISSIPTSETKKAVRWRNNSAPSIPK